MIIVPLKTAWRGSLMKNVQDLRTHIFL